MNIYYVYQLIDPRNNKPFYIGEGKGERARSHQKFKSGCVNPHKDRVIKKIHSDGLEVKIEFLYTGLTKEQSRLLEEEIIQKIGLENLTNITPSANPPINFGEKDRWWGLLVDGFTEPVYCTNYNPKYYPGNIISDNKYWKYVYSTIGIKHPYYE